MKYGKHMKKTSSARITKRALVASAMCTILCALLLFSTSVAWFTASKESNVNEIYSGNLDVELSYSKTMEKNSWKPVTADTKDIFKVKDTGESKEHDMLWEPGAVNVVYFKIENKGSLATKYDFTVEIAHEDKGTNLDGDEFSLSDYIKGGVVEDVTEAYAATDEGRADAVEALGDEVKTLQEISTNQPITDDLETPQEISVNPLITGEMDGVPVISTPEDKQEKIFALVLYMPNTETNNEETNYKTGSDRPKVSLIVKLVATQITSESDSFGNEYDKDAYDEVAIISVDAILE